MVVEGAIAWSPELRAALLFEELCGCVVIARGRPCKLVADRVVGME